MLAGFKGREVTKADMLVAAQELGKIPTSTRNLQKAWLMHTIDSIQDRYGRPILRQDFSLGDEIGQALGFAPSNVREVYDLQRFNIDRQSKIQTVANTYLYLVNQYINQYQSNEDPDFIKRHDTIFAVLANGLNPLELSDVMKTVRNKIMDPKSKQEKQVSDYMKNTIPNTLFNALQEIKQHLEDTGFLKQRVPNVQEKS